jgi:hypothetical protein
LCGSKVRDGETKKGASPWYRVGMASSVDLAESSVVWDKPEIHRRFLLLGVNSFPCSRKATEVLRLQTDFEETTNPHMLEVLG